MMDATDRLELPLIVPGQAQKEMAHNEALALLDVAVQASVVAVGLDTPPTDPQPGSCWIVGPRPTGAWAGHPGAIAGWTGGGWRFVAPRPGLAAWSMADGTHARCEGSGWTLGRLTATELVIDGARVVGARQGTITGPDGGTIVDTQARTAVGAVLAALRAHGLIGT